MIRLEFLVYEASETAQMRRRRPLVDHALVAGCLHIRSLWREESVPQPHLS
jgi:hypothetical protein